MKLHHAAALVLVGWCLVVPGGTGPSLPGGWIISKAYETRDDCEKAAAAMRAEGFRSSGVDSVGADRDDEQAREKIWQQEENATCIPSGDPRLKEK